MLREAPRSRALAGYQVSLESFQKETHIKKDKDMGGNARKRNTARHGRTKFARGVMSPRVLLNAALRELKVTTYTTLIKIHDK